MTLDPFIDAVLVTIKAHALLPRTGTPHAPRQPVVVGVSGGPDSVALLRVLHELADKERATALVAAHLNHGLRGAAADEDQRFVEDLARRLDLPCETGRADVAAEARALGLGIEEAARLARRRFFIEVARRRGAAKVALGHTADDRAETVLFHILRGTGIEGLASLGPRSALLEAEGLEIIRPLIEVPRSLVLAYLNAISQTCREDATNASDAYTRNRLRNELLPLAREKVNPKADEALRRLADQAAAAGEVLADALDAVWRQIVREVEPDAARPPVCGEASEGSPAAIVIDADDFGPLRPWLQGAILRRAVERLGGGLKSMSAERTREAVEALLSKTVAGPVDLPGNLVAARRRRTIRIGRRE